jgi:glycosyltransferase involved in cell wall biosynthesis
MISPQHRSGSSTPPLTVFLPVYNEANSIGPVLREFSETVAKPLKADFLVCEDGSTDGTDRVLEQLAADIPMRLVTSRGRKGFARAVRDGLELAQSDLVFFSDSDGQYDPKDFWKIWEARDSYDLIIGRKMHREEKFYRDLLSRGFHFLVKAFTSVPLKDMDCSFRLIRREVVQAVLPEVRSLAYSFNAEFSIISYRMGFRVLEVPISHRPSLQGHSSIYTWNRIPRIILVQVVGLLRLANRLNRMPPLPRTGSGPDPAHS